MTQCPSGHESATSDYCDVCGMPMSAAPAPVPAAPAVDTPQVSAPSAASAGSRAPSGGATQTCENCKAVNAEANLFCEVCGFDFTTGVMPRVEGGEPSFLTPLSLPDPEPEPDASGAGESAADAPLSAPDSPLAPEPDESPAPAEEPASSAPSSLNLDALEPPVAEPVPSPGEADEQPPSAPPAGDSNMAVDADMAVVLETEVEPALAEPAPADRSANEAVANDPAASGAVEAEPVVAAEPEPVPDPVHTGPKPVNRPPSREVAGEWVVEVWVDPDWFAEQSTDETCPSAAPPEIVRITGSDALVGRRSRTAVPDVDCGIDAAVSRRQALLTSDGRRWWIEDLDSSNGTWVAPAIGPLPTSPITGRTEVDGDDRIYVGAWTRLVIRPALDSELT